MNIKDKTINEIGKRLNQVEELISEKGLGSKQLSRAKRAQRDLNIALVAGCVGLVAGIGAFAWYKLKDQD